MSMRRFTLLAVLFALASIAAQAPPLSPNVFIPGGADAATLRTRYSSGAGLTRFQSMVDIFCKTAANGGQLDAYASEFSGTVKHLGIYWYGYLDYTFPVSGIDYRDCKTGGVADQSKIETPLFALIDSIIADAPPPAVPGTYAPTHSAFCFALQAAGTRLGNPRIQKMIDYLQVNTNSWSRINPIGHAEGSRGRTLYTMSGYCFKGLLSGAEDGGMEGADARIATAAAYINGNTGSKTHLNVSGAEGGYAEGWDYWMSEFLQSIGFVDFYYHDALAQYTGSASEFNPGGLKIHEFYPQWVTHNLAPYQIVPSPKFPTYLHLQTSQTAPRTMDSRGNYPDTSQFGGAYLANLVRRYASTNTTMASLAQWLCEQTYYANCVQPMSANNSTTERWALWTNFLGYHTGVTAQSPATLGITKNLCFTYGQCFFRDAWSYDGTSSMVSFYAAPWQYGAALQYVQASTGSFSIHYGGPIVVMPGTGAHNPIEESGWGGNVMVLTRPLETRGGRSRWDKGGARPLGNFSGVTSTADLTENSQWDLGGLKQTACGSTGAACARIDLSDNAMAHKYQYVKVDLCRAYNGSQNIDRENTSKCTDYRRALVNIQPPIPGTDSGFVIVRDWLTTPDTGVEPRWQLWPAAHVTVTTKTLTVAGAESTDATIPNRNGALGTTYTGTCDGRMFGAIAYTGNAGLAAKGWWTPLEPSSCKIIERGGPNRSNVAYQSDSREWEDPYGVQAGTVEGTDSAGGTGAPYLAPWSGSYHYELLYQTTATSQPMLNLVEYAVSRAGARTSATKLAGTNTIGVRIDANSPRCVIFKTTSSGTLTAGTGDFKLEVASRTFDCLLTDLPASTSITFTRGANITSITNIQTSVTSDTQTSTSQGTLWLRIPTNGGAPSGTSNQVSW